MTEKQQQKRDLITQYILIGLILSVVFGILQQNAILYGIALSAAIFSFHDYVKKGIRRIFEQKGEIISKRLSGHLNWTNTDDELVSVEKFSVAIIDILIAVPMFGLGRESSRYVQIFVLGIAIILFYNIQYKIIKDTLRETNNIIRKKRVFFVLFAASIVYILLFEPQLVSVSFYQTTVLQGFNGGTEESLVAPILMSANNIIPTLISMIIILFGLLIATLYISLLTIIIGIIVSPGLLLVVYLTNVSGDISVYMKGWIIVSILVISSVVIYYRRLTNNHSEAKH